MRNIRIAVVCDQKFFEHLIYCMGGTEAKRMGGRTVSFRLGQRLEFIRVEPKALNVDGMIFDDYFVCGGTEIDDFAYGALMRTLRRGR
jgi:hypothetical protein